MMIESQTTEKNLKSDLEVIKEKLKTEREQLIKDNKL